MQFSNLKVGEMVRLKHPTLDEVFADVTKVEKGCIYVVAHGTANRFRFRDDGSLIVQPGQPKGWKLAKIDPPETLPEPATTGHKRARKAKTTK